MRKLATAVVMLMLVGLPAQALTTKDILSLVAMPLAVDAASRLTGVPASDLAAIVSRLNQANVPPTQFVQVVRYVPAALTVNTPQQPTLVQFVDQQTQQGVTGPALVDAIDQQLVTNWRVVPAIEPYQPETLLVSSSDYIPEPVLAQLDTGADPLALALMPLAVAAVADLAGVPQDQLASLVATLNNANVPPAQFVQVMRYVPVALVSDNGQPFVAYVQQQVAQGITGPALVPAIDQQLPTYGVPQSQITVYAPPPQPVTRPATLSLPAPVDQNYFPPVVQEHVARAAGNPHGGPPGQLKKELGLQTGAEVVHGYKPGRPMTPQVAVAPAPAPPVERHGHEGRGHGRAVETQPMISSSPAPAGPEGHGRGHGGGMPPGQAKKMAPVYAPQAQAPPPPAAAAPAGPPAMPPGQAKKQGNEGEGHGNNGNGNGNGHGHGKG